ncbi:carbon storage regulator [Cohnella thermotolerans]|uniref:carbon storage regulator n=1 Tax=Cohnella thermotolerans TaxID=329858 RepID=UPI00041460F7|nr:carbon storage regulator [Cohnella thermotolerans]
MLILSRRRGQSIVINNDIEIFVTAIEGEQVKLGIVAPKEFNIARKEVLEEVRLTNNMSLNAHVDLEDLKSWSLRTKNTGE